MTAGYSSTPLAKKLGIRGGSILALLDAPDGFESALQPSLPPGVGIRHDARAAADVFVLFATRAARMRSRLLVARRRMPTHGSIWIAWPKKSSPRATTLDFDAVRATGLDAGLVHNKICAIDEDWSALRLVIRLRDR